MIDLNTIVGSWKTPLKELFEDPKIINDLNIVSSMYKEGRPIYPKQADVFKAFIECPYDELKVVIILQDPYHDGSATGIALANSDISNKISPSLRIVRNTIRMNMYKGDDFKFDPSLISWANQGILMFNTALTVDAGTPLSHVKLWSSFTERLLIKLSETKRDIIYCMWGKQARDYAVYMNNKDNLLLYSTHPVYAVYRGSVWDCDHFTRINEHLIKLGKQPIKW